MQKTCTWKGHQVRFKRTTTIIRIILFVNIARILQIIKVIRFVLYQYQETGRSLSAKILVGASQLTFLEDEEKLDDS